MWLIFGIIYLSIGVAYVMYDWYSDKKEAYISAKRNSETDDSGLIAYWLLSGLFWPLMICLFLPTRKQEYEQDEFITL